MLDRRQFITVGVGAFVVAGLPLGLGRRRQPRTIKRSIPVMGTIATFAVVHEDVAVAERAIDAAIAELRRVDRTMTRFSNESDIGRANLFSGQPVSVGRDTALVIAEALRWANLTGGAFDPAIGGIVQAWDVTHRHEPPRRELIEPLAGQALYKAVEVDASRVFFHDARARIDLGAIAKGFAVDRAVEALRANGVRNGVVEAGGDLYAMGKTVEGDDWQIGIQAPDDDRALAAMVPASDCAIATSGTYRQFFRYRGQRYHHLMDPRTAAPRATPVRSLTVRADRCMHADVAATALYGMSVADANALLARATPGARVEAEL